MGALVVGPRCKSPLEGNLRRGVAVVLVGGALVGRSLGASDGRAAGRSELFLRVFSLSDVREERGTVMMGL